jgi:hypothetical protein
MPTMMASTIGSALDSCHVTNVDSMAISPWAKLKRPVVRNTITMASATAA